MRRSNPIHAIPLNPTDTPESIRQKDRAVSPTDLIRNYYAAWNAGDSARIAECLSKNFTGHSDESTFTTTELLTFRRHLADEYTDFTVTEHDLIAGGDRIAVRWITRGTTTEVRMRWHGVTIYHIQQGLIAELWDVRGTAAPDNKAA